MSDKYFNSRIPRFFRSQDGWGTPFFLFLTIVVMIMGGLALDFSRGIERRAHLQAATDAAALAAAQELPDEDAATALGLSIARLHFSTAGENHSILASDFIYGNWDVDNEVFVPGGTPVDAVRVVGTRRNDRGNAVRTHLMQVVGVDTFDINVSALVRAKLGGSCKSGGFFSDDVLTTGSDNSLLGNFCLYGKKHVDLNSDNYFESGTSVVMEDKKNLLQGSDNVGIDEALSSGTFDLTLPAMTNVILASAEGGSLDNMPSYITKGPEFIQEIKKGKIEDGSHPDNGKYLIEGTLYVVQKDVSFKEHPFKNVAIVASNNVIDVGSNARYHNVLFVARKEIEIGSNNSIGHPDGCATGKFDTYMFSNRFIYIRSGARLFGLQFGTTGFVNLNSFQGGVNGVYGESNGPFEISSNAVYGGCPNELVSDYGVVGPTGGSGGDITGIALIQ